MSKRDEHDLAGALIAKAAGDEAGLRALAENYDVPDHVVGFLAQQAVEKALNAASTLTPWAVEFRYADPYDDTPPLDRAEALKTVVAIREWATQAIGVDR